MHGATLAPRWLMNISELRERIREIGARVSVELHDDDSVAVLTGVVDDEEQRAAIMALVSREHALHIEDRLVVKSDWAEERGAQETEFGTPEARHATGSVGFDRVP